MFQHLARSYSLVPLAILGFALTLTAGNAGAQERTAKRATPRPDGQRAEIVFDVPLDAIIYIDGKRTYNTGRYRRFVTPPLAAGRRYFYDVKISWVDGSRAKETTRHVGFTAGQRVMLNFGKPSFRENTQDLYVDPAAPTPWTNNYHEDFLNLPYFPNSPYIFPGYRLYPR